MKIAFGMIVFEGDYVLKECLEQVYPFASQILIAEGPVSYWQRQGRTTSTDNTNKIISELKAFCPIKIVMKITIHPYNTNFTYFATILDLSTLKKFLKANINNKILVIPPRVPVSPNICNGVNSAEAFLSVDISKKLLSPPLIPTDDFESRTIAVPYPTPITGEIVKVSQTFFIFANRIRLEPAFEPSSVKLKNPI